MATQQPPNLQVESPAIPPPEPPLNHVPTDVVEDKSGVPPSHNFQMVEDSKVPVVAQQNPDTAGIITSKGYNDRENSAVAENKTSKGSYDRDVALADLEKEKKLSFINAWEQSEKSKVQNKSQKKIAEVNAWENTQKAKIEAKLKKVEQELENKKAENAEKMRNKTALIHKEAEERRAMIEAKRGEELLKAEEMAAKHRATGHVPKKSFGCFGS